MAKMTRGTRGRKSIGRKPREVLSIRMDPDLRKRVEASAAAHSKGSVSAEINRLLATALAPRASDRNIRAISYILEYLTGTLGPEWQSDPWVFDAFKAAVSDVLDRIRPTGVYRPSERGRQWLKLRYPDWGESDFDSARPEEYGLFVSLTTWMLIQGAVAELPPGITGPYSGWPLAFPQIRDQLGIEYDDDMTDLIGRALDRLPAVMAANREDKK